MAAVDLGLETCGDEHGPRVRTERDPTVCPSDVERLLAHAVAGEEAAVGRRRSQIAKANIPSRRSSSAVPHSSYP